MNPENLEGARLFLDQILADPDNDALRYYLADWLEERGDPRGEFIHVQMQIASLEKGMPYRYVLEKREEEILNQYNLQWLGITDPAQVPEGWKYERGFVNWFKCSYQLWLNIHQFILPLHPLRSVDLTTAVFGYNSGHIELDRLHLRFHWPKIEFTIPPRRTGFSSGAIYTAS